MRYGLDEAHYDAQCLRSSAYGSDGCGRRLHDLSGEFFQRRYVLAEFAHSCTHGDPEEARALVRAISKNDLAARRNSNTESLPVRVLPPPMLFFRQYWLNKRGMGPLPSPRDARETIGT
jgi:hypothetical protein